MWKCAKCGETIGDQFDSCWRCSSPKGVAASTGAPVGESDGKTTEKWRLTFHKVRGTLATWDELFARAADFATDIGPERVLNISHSADQGDGVVTVWYWTTEEEPKL